VSRIKACFNALKKQHRKALIPYFTAGDPSPEFTVPLMHAMVEAGADIIELGVPFSDPMADGPVIQAACERALKFNVGLATILELVASFRKSDNQTPIVLMGYLNPVEVMGYDRFAGLAAEAGVDGVLTVDLPPEEAHELVTVLKGADIDPIFLIAPNSNSDRIKAICRAGSGFVYYVSLKGVTGANTLDIHSVARKVKQIRRYTSKPIGVGFGIKDAASAAQVARIADAVVVGSALVKRIQENADRPAVLDTEMASVLRPMRVAIDELSAMQQSATNLE
jgi:tryptophan synthase alpha chain